MESHVLIIDDNEAHAETVAEAIGKPGVRCTVATSGRRGLEILREDPVDIVVTDLVMPDVDGFKVLANAKAADDSVEVIVVTGHASIESAVEAMKRGAAEFVTKPVNLEELRTKVAKQVEKQRLKRENRELRDALDKRYGFEGIVGRSTAMETILDQLRQVSRTVATLLVVGESGTGKELIARAAHNNSPRRGGPFVAINCAALNEGVLESELFGHEKGAFTGAISRRKGLFETADGGTLFLDEVGDLPAPTQVKLLRVIEYREITRVGGNEPIKVDVRIVAATHRDLREEVKEGRFRQDLFFRLNVVTIRVPPLRERREDIPLLIDSFVREFSMLHGKEIEGVTPEARDLLASYSWPGNVRELRNCLESMVVITRRKTLDVIDVPTHVAGERSGPGAPGTIAAKGPVAPLRDLEKASIEAALAETGGNRHRAAHLLGIGERTLYRKLKRYGLG